MRRFSLQFIYFWYNANMKKIDLQNVIWKEGKYHVAQCLNVDVSSFGKTKKEAIKNIEEALELYFEDSNKKGYFQKVENPTISKKRLAYA
jgi:predicted RNase H-like HicB family nuclease